MAPTLVSVRSALTFLSVFGAANAGFIGNLVQDFNSRLQASVCTPVTTTIIRTVSASAVTVTRTALASPVTITNLVTITTSIQSSPSTSLITSTNSSSTSNTTRTSTSSSSTAIIAPIGQGNTRSTNTTGSNANTTDISSSASISTLATASAGTVTLPYATYAATLNDSNSLYTYTNIRYAEPPTGSLRFKNPVAPSTINTTIQDGSYGQTCYQLEQGANSAAPNQGEDCLFLDLVVPSNIPNNTLLPVLFYLYGGGYHSGQKEIYDGSPLVTASNNSIIYIVPNYRVGAFGFFGDQFGTGDVMPGLMDQVMAMEWVQQYIHLFGGNKDEVTVAGHSAGGGSLVTHLISHGGEGTLPFQKAAVMSPAVPPNFPEYIKTRNEEILEYFGYENATLDEILALPASTINDFTAHHGASGWGPIVDGDYFRELPGYAFSAGRYHTSLPIISGKLSDESHNYIPTTSPLIINGSSDIRDMMYDTKEYMTSFFATMGFHLPDDVVDQVWDLYPTINDTDLYYTMFGKYDHIYTEMLFSCYSYYLETSYDDVHAWYFDIAPGYHAQENPYLFLGGKGSGSTSSYAINATVSEYMKNYLVNFVMDGDVNAGGVAPTWDAYSVAKQNIELGSSNVGMIADPMTNSRCVFWETNIS